MKNVLILASLILPLLTSCQGSQDPELSRASASLRKMASSSLLGNSCFFVAYPNGTPSDYVRYTFSDLAAAELPVAMDEMEAKQMQSAGMTPFPNSVVLSPLTRQQLDSKEVVLEPDDVNRTIVVKAYLPKEQTLQFQDQLPLGTATPNAGVEELCQSNMDMGINPF